MKPSLASSIIVCVLLLLSNISLAVEARLRIGVVRPKTGESAPLGTELWQGIKLAQKLHSKHMPQINSLVEIFEADDAGSPNQALKVTEDLIRRQRVHVLIGSVNNLLNQSVADAAIRMNRMTILPFATQDQLISRSEMLFSATMTEQEQGRSIGQFSSEELQRKKAVILSELDNPYSQSLATGFRQSFEAAGGRIVTELHYSFERQNYEELVNSIASEQADLIFIPGFFQDAAHMIRQIKPRVSSSTVFIGGDGWDDPQIASLLPVSAGSYFFFTPFSMSTASPELQSFFKNYQAEYRQTPSALAYFGFAAMDALMATYLKTNTNRSEALTRQLTRPQELNSLLGSFQVTGGGTIFRPSSMMSITSGQVRLHQTIQPKL
ncbi:MAG: ABC transporter substrate-binding protein [Oligoflexus sp.]